MKLAIDVIIGSTKRLRIIVEVPSATMLVSALKIVFKGVLTEALKTGSIRDNNRSRPITAEERIVLSRLNSVPTPFQSSGILLEDDKTLEDYKITNLAVILVRDAAYTQEAKHVALETSPSAEPNEEEEKEKEDKRAEEVDFLSWDDEWLSSDEPDELLNAVEALAKAPPALSGALEAGVPPAKREETKDTVALTPTPVSPLSSSPVSSMEKSRDEKEVNDEEAEFLRLVSEWESLGEPLHDAIQDACARYEKPWLWSSRKSEIDRVRALQARVRELPKEPKDTQTLSLLLLLKEQFGVKETSAELCDKKRLNALLLASLGKNTIIRNYFDGPPLFKDWFFQDISALILVPALKTQSPEKQVAAVTNLAQRSFLRYHLLLFFSTSTEARGKLWEKAWQFLTPTDYEKVLKGLTERHLIEFLSVYKHTIRTLSFDYYTRLILAICTRLPERSDEIIASCVPLNLQQLLLYLQRSETIKKDSTVSADEKKEADIHSETDRLMSLLCEKLSHCGISIYILDNVINRLLTDASITEASSYVARQLTHCYDVHGDLSTLVLFNAEQLEGVLPKQRLATLYSCRATLIKQESINKVLQLVPPEDRFLAVHLLDYWLSVFKHRPRFLDVPDGYTFCPDEETFEKRLKIFKETPNLFFQYLLYKQGTYSRRLLYRWDRCILIPPVYACIGSTYQDLFYKKGEQAMREALLAQLPPEKRASQEKVTLDALTYCCVVNEVSGRAAGITAHLKEFTFPDAVISLITAYQVPHYAKAFIRGTRPAATMVLAREEEHGGRILFEEMRVSATPAISTPLGISNGISSSSGSSSSSHTLVRASVTPALTAPSGTSAHFQPATRGTSVPMSVTPNSNDSTPISSEPL